MDSEYTAQSAFRLSGSLLLLAAIPLWAMVATYIDETSSHPLRLGWALGGGVGALVFSAFFFGLASIRGATERATDRLERRLLDLADEQPDPTTK